MLETSEALETWKNDTPGTLRSPGNLGKLGQPGHIGNLVTIFGPWNILETLHTLNTLETLKTLEALDVLDSLGNQGLSQLFFNVFPILSHNLYKMFPVIPWPKAFFIHLLITF